MANIKVSEMTEATSFDDGDYTMIVQANQNKKISKENIFNDINTNIGDISQLETSDKTSVVNSINSLMPVILFEDTQGTMENITLNDDIANYKYYEIIYARQTGENVYGYSSIKMPTTYLTDVNFINSIYLGRILRIYSANITISGTTLTRNYDNYINFTGTNAFNFGSAISLAIYKVIGYK